MGTTKVTFEQFSHQTKDLISVKFGDVLTDQPELKKRVIFCKSLSVYLCIFKVIVFKRVC